MSRIIEFDIPTKDGIEQARGIPMWFAIGERKVKFMLQYDEDKARYLTHFASGYRCGSLDDAGVELMCKTSTYHRFTKKQLAQFLIDKMIARFGTEVLLEKLDSVPVINQVKMLVTATARIRPKTGGFVATVPKLTERKDK